MYGIHDTEAPFLWVHNFLARLSQQCLTIGVENFFRVTL